MHDFYNQTDGCLRRHSRCRCGSWRPYRQCCWEADERYAAREWIRAEPHRRVHEAARQRGLDTSTFVGDEEAYARFAAEVGVELPLEHTCDPDRDCDEWAASTSSPSASGS